MQSDQQAYPRKVVPPLAFQVGTGFMYNPPVAPTLSSSLPSVKHLRPFHGVELQSSEVCPKNFIIFDQTDNRSRVMFNPALAHKFDGANFDIHASYVQDNIGRKDKQKEISESSSPVKEDTEDIDALLSLEEEEDEEEVSTARTLGSYGSSSPDSCSAYTSKPSKRRLSSSIQKSVSSSSSSRSSNSGKSERKRQRMKKMMSTLRGIVPGGDRMNTAAVLDEAVRYLKSLKVEMKKSSIANFKN